MSLHRSLGLKETQEIVGSADNFWIWSPETGWDLSRPTPSEAVPAYCRLSLKCEISNVVIDTRKTALLIIDMQNFSLCNALNTNISVPAISRAQETLLRFAIPAARQAKIQIIWLNWGLTEEDLQTIAPAALRIFNWRANSNAVDYGFSGSTGYHQQGNDVVQCGEIKRRTGLGDDLGEVILEDGAKIDAGRALLRGTWNAGIHGPLAVAFEEGQAASRADVLLYKTKNSGLYDATSECYQYLHARGIKTLLFSGMNTDQCVMATLQDAHAGGFDTILLKDGCATDSPRYSQQSAEFNCCRNWGFLSSCIALAEAAEIIDAKSKHSLRPDLGPTKM